VGLFGFALVLPAGASADDTAVVQSPPASAGAEYSSGSIGYDISYPQCNSLTTMVVAPDISSAQYGIIGINGGRAFTTNRCFSPEYAAATSQGIPVSFYINMSVAHGQNSSYGMSGPLGTCGANDQMCQAYTFGWNAAQYANNVVNQAAQSLGVATTPTTWWLDIETANYWSPNKSVNAEAIQGATDFLRGSPNTSTIGVYSVSGAWNSIVGSSFQPGVPLWLAGGHTLARAGTMCSQSSFTGGPVTLVQYAGQSADADIAC
jgi:hypothetical protein